MKNILYVLKRLEHFLYKKAVKPFLMTASTYSRNHLIFLFLSILLGYSLLEISSFNHTSEFLSFIQLHPGFFIINIILFSFLYSFLYLLFSSHRLTTFIMGILVIIAGIANYTKLGARQDLILPTDFTIIGEWKTAIDSVTINLRLQNFFSIFFFLLLFYYGFLLDFSKKKLKIKRKKKTVAASFLLWIFTATLFHVAVISPTVTHIYLDKNGRNYQSTNFTHKLYGCCYLFNQQLITKENPVSSAKAKSHYNTLLTKAKDASTQEKPDDSHIITPNIITIMSESLWDISDFSKEVQWDVNPMEVFQDTIKKHSGGSISVNIYGGSTANTEFEFLTGLSTKYLPGGQVAYNSIESLQPSLASYLKNNFDYSTVAIHPFFPTFWNRNTVYPLLGIRQFYSNKNMTYKEPFDVYISDDSLTNEIIEKYTWHKKNHKGPLFSFNVSMANHSLAISGIDKSNENNYEKKVSYTLKHPNTLSKSEKSQLNRYINGVYASGEALQKLMDYFDTIDDPTVIVLFGDHAPPLANNIYKSCLGYDSSTAKTSEELARFYETPLVIYSNYPLPKVTIDGANASYLSSILLKQIGIPLSNICTINDYLMTTLPTNTKYTVKDQDGNILSQLSDKEENLDNTNYEMFYEMLYGKKELPKLWNETN